MVQIRKSLRLRFVALLGMLWAACVYPTDRSGRLRVLIEPIPAVVRGEIHELTGLVVDEAGTSVPNAEVLFSSTNPLVALVGEDGTMLAVGPGETDIEARARDFQDAEPGVRPIHVRDLIEVDSIRPRLARFGDTMSVFGVGLNPGRLLLTDLGGQGAFVKHWVPDVPDAENRFGVLTVWVPAFADLRSRFTALGVDGLAQSPDTATILQFDVYEPNDTLPWDFGPLTQGVVNPALAFEFRARDDSIRTDWYRFEQRSRGDRTIVIRSDDVGPETYQVFFTDSLVWNGPQREFEIGPRSSTFGPGFHTCQGLAFGPPQLGVDSVLIALKDLPPGTYDILAAYVRRGAYQMQILPTYRSALPPDAAEENDFCQNAAPVTLSGRRELTIDNPGDIDWFRFQLDQPMAGVRFDVDAVEADADLDLYVLRDFRPDSLILIGFSNIGGASDEVITSLAAGNYFLVVVDFAGRPTPYSLNIATGIVQPTGSGVAQQQGRQGGVTPLLFRKNRPSGS